MSTASRRPVAGAASGMLLGVVGWIVFVRMHWDLHVADLGLAMGLGGLLGMVVGLGGHRHVSIYWGWAAAIFGLVTLVPLVANGRGGAWPPGTVYLWPGLADWEPVLLIHASVATAIATAATVVHRLRVATNDADRAADLLGLRQLFLVTAAFAAMFGLFRWLAAPPAVFFTVLILAAGRPVSALVVAAARARRDQSPNTE